MGLKGRKPRKRAGPRAAPEWLAGLADREPAERAFLEAVTFDMARDARNAGDQAPPGVIESQAVLDAASTLSEIGFLDAALNVDAIERREGRPRTTSAADFHRIAEIPHRLADDPALLDAFERHLDLLEPDRAAAVRAVVGGARELEPGEPATRSRFELNVRRSRAELEQTLRDLLAPIERRIEAYNARVEAIGSGEEWKHAELEAERLAIEEALEQIETQLAVERLLATTPEGGFVRVHKLLDGIRGRIRDRGEEGKT